MKQILAGLLIVAGSFISSNGQSTSAPLVVGQPAPGFSIKDVNGKTHSLKDDHGKIAVVVFLSTECPFSNAYAERLRAIANDYAKQNVAVIGINAHPTETMDEIRDYARKNRFDFPILKDEDSKVADQYGATRTPEVFVVDASGTLRYHGRIDNSKDPARVQRNDLREALDELLAGKPVSVAETKSFGCPIKMVRKNAVVTTNENADVPQRFPQVRFANSLVPQKKPASQRTHAVTPKKPAAAGFTPKVVPLKPVDFAKFKDSAKGKVLVINFWATWCGPCVAEFPEFVALDAKYRDQGVKIVGISADEISDLKTKVVAFLREHKATFENFVQDTDDPQQMIDVVNKDWPGILPATFVFDKQGNPVFSHFGIINRDELTGVIEKALK